MLSKDNKYKNIINGGKSHEKDQINSCICTCTGYMRVNGSLRK